YVPPRPCRLETQLRGSPPAPTRVEESVGTLIPLGDASRRPLHRSVVTAVIILVNALVFVLELQGGESFVTRWSAIPADIVAGHHWVTLLTAMFMHASWSHIIGNMVFVRVTFVPAALLIGVWFLLQLLSLGAVATTVQTGGVAYVAHIGGMVFGALTARLFEAPRSREWSKP